MVDRLPEDISGMNPTCNEAQMRRAMHSLQRQIKKIRNDISLDIGLTMLYGKATANWSSSLWAVPVNPVEDLAGTNPDTDTVHVVYFPVTTWGTPNVVTGQVIAYAVGSDGNFVCQDLDEPVGRAEWYTGSSANISAGWALMNGTANALANGGSGIDSSSRFILSATTAGSTGGSTTHDHDIVVDSDGGFSVPASNEITGIVITNTALTGITVGNHTSQDIVDCIQDHTKQQVADCIADHTCAEIAQCLDDHDTADLNGVFDDHAQHSHLLSGSVMVAAGSDELVPADGDCTGNVSGDACAGLGANELGHDALQSLQHGEQVAADPVDHDPHPDNDPLEHNAVALEVVTHTVTDIGHVHIISDTGHQHLVTVGNHTHDAASSEESNVPPYVGLLLIERINNSEEVVNP